MTYSDYLVDVKAALAAAAVVVLGKCDIDEVSVNRNETDVHLNTLICRVSARTDSKAFRITLIVIDGVEPNDVHRMALAKYFLQSRPDYKYIKEAMLSVGYWYPPEGVSHIDAVWCRHQPLSVDGDLLDAIIARRAILLGESPDVIAARAAANATKMLSEKDFLWVS
jgi:hypothetical protein